MWKEVLVIVAVLETALGASIYHCPEGTPCQTLEGYLDTSSFDFLTKFSEKQFRTIVHLKMSDAAVNKVDPRLKYLKNLSYLDLSHNNVQISSIPSLNSLKTLILKANNLKAINLTALPQNIEEIDISHNLLTQIPRDWISLKYLKKMHLYKNPIDCDCNNVLSYDRLIKSGVSVPESVTCHSPNKYIGKDITAINCSIDDIMVYDEPEEGSGDADIFDESVNTEIYKVPFVEEKEDDVIIEDNTIIDDKAVEEEEGSGNEGSGFGIFPDTGVIGCIENCSTPGPVGENDEEFASPLPSAIDQARILFQDINLFEDHPAMTSSVATSSTTSKTTVTTTSAPVAFTEAQIPIKEPKILKETETKLDRQSDKSVDVEEIGHGTRTGELERASAAPSDSTAVYAIVGVGLFLAVLFVIAFVKGRRSKRRQEKRDIPNSLGEEMKPLSKLSISATNDKANRNSNIPENIPLINGQNGKTKDDTVLLKSFTPLAHPELTKEDSEEDEELQQNGYNSEPDGVEIRPKSELLTPQRARVTIRESEIPDSIPKTPVLVQRKKNSEGEIVTTVVP
nr:protein windpipe [Leptinotarsa decemlineata]